MIIKYEWLILLCVIYLYSVYSMWNFVRISHSKGGRWSRIDPTGIDVFFTFAPIFNTTACICNYFEAHPIIIRVFGKRIIDFIYKIER